MARNAGPSSSKSAIGATPNLRLQRWGAGGEPQRHRHLVAHRRPVRVSILLPVSRDTRDAAVGLAQVQVVVALASVAHEHEPLAVRRPADAGVVARLLHDPREKELALSLRRRRLLVNGLDHVAVEAHDQDLLVVTARTLEREHVADGRPDWVRVVASGGDGNKRPHELRLDPGRLGLLFGERRQRSRGEQDQQRAHEFTVPGSGRGIGAPPRGPARKWEYPRAFSGRSRSTRATPGSRCSSPLAAS